MKKRVNIGERVRVISVDFRTSHHGYSVGEVYDVVGLTGTCRYPEIITSVRKTWLTPDEFEVVSGTPTEKSIPVKIRLLSEHARIPTYSTSGAAAFDLYAAEDAIIGPGETVKVPLGFAVELPPGYEMQIRPRSGVSLKTKLRVANSPGTIDSDYRGEVAVIVDNMAKTDDIICGNEYGWAVLISQKGGAYDASGREITEMHGKYLDGTYVIRRGDRIAQAVIIPVPRVEFVQVDEELTQTERGDGGFGHTGTNGRSESMVKVLESAYGGERAYGTG